MDRSTKRLAIFAVGILLLALFAWQLRPTPAPPLRPEATPPPAEVATTPSPRTTPLATPTPPAATPPATTAAVPIDEALEAAFPDDRTVRCSAKHLDAGVLMPLSTTEHSARGIRFTHVTQGTLVAVVDEPEGEVMLSEYMQPVAMLRWSSADPQGTCTVSPVAWERLTGEVRWADGSPAVDAEVRGCTHGEVLRTDAEGRFQTRRVRGTTCYPMVFIVHGTAFGKSDVVEVTDDSSLPIALTVPDPADLYDESAVGEMLEVYRKMVSASVDARTQDNAPAAAVDRAGAPETRALLARWGDDLGAMFDAMHDDANRLTEEAETAADLRDIWLNLY